MALAMARTERGASGEAVGAGASDMGISSHGVALATHFPSVKRPSAPGAAIGGAMCNDGEFAVEILAYRFPFVDPLFAMRLISESHLLD
jgi:hypothetical protein